MLVAAMTVDRRGDLFVPLVYHSHMCSSTCEGIVAAFDALHDAVSDVLDVSPEGA
jgi:hypothetical protein